MAKRKHIGSQVSRALLARSGNKCAYPGCIHALFNSENIFVAHTCHIEGVSGERYNPKLSLEEVNSYNNILLMCYKHHKETNDEKKFTVEVLREMKVKHEANFIFSPFLVDMSHVFSLRKELEQYWSNVKNVNENEHLVPDLKIEIKTNATYDELDKELRDTLASLDELFSSFDESEKKKNWDTFYLGLPNHMTISIVLLEQMRIKFYEQYILNNPNDIAMRNKLSILQKEFIENTAKYAGHVD